MKTVSLSSRSRDKHLHIEAPGCIVNIRIGLTNSNGQAVTSVSISADGKRYSGEQGWFVATEDFENLNPRDIAEGFRCRIVQDKA